MIDDPVISSPAFWVLAMVVAHLAALGATNRSRSGRLVSWLRRDMDELSERTDSVRDRLQQDLNELFEDLADDIREAREETCRHWHVQMERRGDSHVLVCQRCRKTVKKGEERPN